MVSLKSISYSLATFPLAALLYSSPSGFRVLANPSDPSMSLARLHTVKMPKTTLSSAAPEFESVNATIADPPTKGGSFLIPPSDYCTAKRLATTVAFSSIKQWKYIRSEQNLGSLFAHQVKFFSPNVNSIMSSWCVQFHHLIMVCDRDLISRVYPSPHKHLTLTYVFYSRCHVCRGQYCAKHIGDVRTFLCFYWDITSHHKLARILLAVCLNAGNCFWVVKTDTNNSRLTCQVIRE